MMSGAFRDAIAALPGFHPLGSERSGIAVQEIPDDDYRAWLTDQNGAIAFEGALRFFPIIGQELADIRTWNSNELWKYAYGARTPSSLLLFAEDAFGLQFGFDARGSVAIFWSETGEIEPLDIRIAEFIAAAEHDPNGTISLELYEQARAQLGPLGLNQHYAFHVETALGGELSVDNLLVMDAVNHMRALGKIANQI